jgi:ribonuclease T2
MLDIMPARGLVIHQWRTHGTCSGLSPERYFETVRRARERIVIPEQFRRLENYTMVSPAAVEEGVSRRQSRSQARHDRRHLRQPPPARGPHLHEHRPRLPACEEIDRRACRIPRVVMPPVRGG